MDIVNKFNDVIGSDSYTCKSCMLNLIVHTKTSDVYRKVLTLLKNEDAQFHTYLHSEKHTELLYAIFIEQHRKIKKQSPRKNWIQS